MTNECFKLGQDLGSGLEGRKQKKSNGPIGPKMITGADILRMRNMIDKKWLSGAIIIV